GRYDHADRSGSTGGKGFFETRFLVDGPRTLIVYGDSPNGDRRNGHGQIESQRLEYRNRMVARHRVPLRLDSFLGEPRFANGHPVRVNTRPWRLTVSSIRNRGINSSYRSTSHLEISCGRAMDRPFRKQEAVYVLGSSVRVSSRGWNTAGDSL